MSTFSRLRRHAAIGLALAAAAPLLAASVPAAHPRARSTPGVPAPVRRLDMRDLNGVSRSIPAAGRRATVLLFLGVDCPISNAFAPELRRLRTAYQPKGVAFYRIYPEPGLTPGALRDHARAFSLPGPLLLDRDQRLLSAVGATVTPEAALLSPDGRLRYRGRIDDRFPALGRRRAPTRHDLAAALDAVLAGRAPAAGVSKPIGCAVTRVRAKAEGVTFNRDVAPILFEHCSSCHRPGQTAPFSLLSYADARRHARQIALTTERRIMPPWKADSHGEFYSERRLDPAQIALLRAWAAAGAPEGDPARKPRPPQYPDGWQNGLPEAVFAPAKPYDVEPDGPDVYRCFVIPTHYAGDRYISGVEFRPGNPAVVHHALVLLDTSGMARKLDEADPGPGFASSASTPRFPVAGALGAWAPGMQPIAPPDGVGLLLPKGADIILEVHYHKNGKRESDLTRLGLRFCRTPVDKRLRCFAVTDLNLRIPAGEADHRIAVSRPLPADATIYQVTPHMHLLGREMTVTATLPGGKERRLVRVRDWDFRWQTTYRFREPFHLPAGTVISIAARYDNTEANPSNPNHPPRTVTLGEQTTDEMCTAYVGLTLDEEHLTRGLPAKDYPLWGIDGL
jgi:hypothetical protein